MSEPISKGGTAHPRLTRQQKAAAVIVSLGTDKASQLYQYMDPEDVEQITLEVAKLGYLDSSATEDVLTEYYQMCMTNKAVTEGGLEYARAVLEKAFGQQTATSLLEKVTKSLKNREFAFLNKADEKSLYAALQHERPQTIALVLSYVDAEKSAAVIEELDDERQVRVIENMANMESASPTAVKIIEAEMEKKFSSLMTASNVKVGGVDFVADVMNNLDRSSEKNIFDRLAEYNEPLADEIRKRMFVFEDIVTMDDRSVQRFVRDCDPRDLVLALKGANSDVANKIFTNMSARMAQSIREFIKSEVNEQGNKIKKVRSFDKVIGEVGFDDKQKKLAKKYLEELKGSYLAKDTLKNQDEKIKFIKKVSELSYENYEKYKILPSITVGQAILESRWGESDLSKNSNNIFGVKADARWNGKVVEVNTSENYDDKIVAKFRKYDSIKDSINDHGKFLTENKRYEESGLFKATHYTTQAQALEDAGYATKKNEDGELIYADILIDLIKKYNLQLLDREVQEIN